MASIVSNPDAIKVLLIKGVPINPLDNDGRTPLDLSGSSAHITFTFDELKVIELCGEELKKHGGKLGRLLKNK